MGFFEDFGKGFVQGFTKPFTTTRALIEGKNPLVKNYGDRGGRRRSTRKGQVRKTARRAYVKKGDRGGVRVKGYRRNGKRVRGHRRRKPRR